MLPDLLKPLLRPFTRLLLRTVPVTDPWMRYRQAVPLERFGAGAKRDFQWYFEGESRVAVSSIDEVKAWLAGCTYIGDPELFQEVDFWQHPATFERLRMGDCEDFALWTWRKLVRLGFEAQFVAGRLRKTEGVSRGHAWVLFRQEDRDFVFDPVAGDEGAMVRPLEEVRAEYVPEVSVDRAFDRYVFGGYLQQLRSHRRPSAAVAAA